MRISRLFLPLLFAFALLTAQQGGAAHALSHALEKLSEQTQTQKQGNQVPHHHACEKCATFAQLGSAPIMGTYTFLLTVLSSETFQYRSGTFRFAHVLAAVARGPPAVRIP